jgi:HK97 family phage major capsid protein
MTTTREIRSRLEAARTEMRGILAAPAGADGDLSPEQAARFDAIRGEADRLAQNEARVAALEDMERRSAGQPVSSTGDNRLDAELRGYSLTRAIAYSAGLPDVDAGREREIGQEIARRSGQAFRGLAVPMAVFQRPAETRAVLASGTGGSLIATELQNQVIDRFRNASFVRQAGATVVDGLVGNVSFPALTASASAQWIADGSALTLSDPTLAQVQLSPKTCGVLTEYSRQTLLQSSPAVDEVIRNDFAKLLAGALDNAAINGTGTANQPRGILATPGIGSVAIGANGGALTFDAVQDLAGQVADANGDGGTSSFATNTKVRRAIRKLKDSQNRPLGESAVLGGSPVAYSNWIPSNGAKGSGTNLSAMIWGQWSEVLIGVWSALDLTSNPFGDAYARGGVQVRGFMTLDVNVKHAAAFAAITDIVA